MNLHNFLSELKRRNVYKVAVATFALAIFSACETPSHGKTFLEFSPVKRY